MLALTESLRASDVLKSLQKVLTASCFLKMFTNSMKKQIFRKVTENLVYGMGSGRAESQFQDT